MTLKERASCINTIELLKRMAFNVHGLMDAVDAENCDKIIKMLNDDNPRWIPCSERMPKDNRQVLVYARNVHFALAKYDEMREANGIYEKQWVTFDAWKPFYKIKDVIAWMPLPEPYGGESE